MFLKETISTIALVSCKQVEKKTAKFGFQS